MLKPFELYEPATVSEAIGLLDKYQGAKVVAGGTDVFIEMHAGKRIDTLVDLKKIKELYPVSFDQEKGLTIGALATHAELERNKYAKKYYPALIDAIEKIGSVQVRMKGTVAGNICNASPAADSAGALLLYDAMVVIQGKKGARKVSIADFFTGPKRNCLEQGEIVTEITLAAPTENSGSAYSKLMNRGAMEIGIMSTGIKVACDKAGKCNFARVSLCAVAPTPIRVWEAEEYLMGKELNKDSIIAAAEIAYQTAAPKTWRNSEEWSKDMVKVYIPRTMDIAIGRMQKGEF